MGSPIGSRGVGLSSEFGEAGGKGCLPPRKRQVGKLDGQIQVYKEVRVKDGWLESWLLGKSLQYNTNPCNSQYFQVGGF